MTWALVRNARSAPFEPLVLEPPPRLGVPRVLVPPSDPSGLLAAARAVRHRLGRPHPTGTPAVVADDERAPMRRRGADHDGSVGLLTTPASASPW